MATSRVIRPATFRDDLLRRSADACLGRKPLQQRLWEIYSRESGAEVALLVGSPGSGKTTLARWLRWRVQENGGQVAWLRSDPTAETQASLLEGIEGAPLDKLGKGVSRDLLVVDGFERLTLVADWLFADVVGALGSNVLVLLISRERLPPELRNKHDLTDRWHELAVPPLASEDARAMLRAARVPARVAERVVTWSGGHALALRLALEEWSGRDGATTQLPSERLSTLLADAIVAGVPSVAHEQALYCLAIAGVVDRTMLAAMIGGVDRGGELHAIHQWLERLPEVEQVEQGLRLDPLFRDALYRALAGREPDRLQLLAERALRVLVPRILQRDLHAAHPLIKEASSALRFWQSNPRCFRPSAIDEVTMHGGLAAAGLAAALVEKRQGKDSRRAFTTAVDAEPGHLAVLLDGDDKVRAAMQAIPVDATVPARSADPLVQAVLEHLATTAMADGMLLVRWLVDAETSDAPTPLLVHLVALAPLLAIAHPRATQLGVLVEKSELAPGQPDWLTIGASLGCKRAAGFEITTAGKTYWLLHATIDELLAPFSTTPQPAEARLLATLLAPAGLRPSSGAPVHDTTRPTADSTLPRDEFSLALRRALENMHVPPLLRQSPLSAVVDRVASPEVRRWPMADQRLSQWLAEGIARLALSEGTVKWAEVLRATYLRVQPKQQAVAVDLGIPYGTYRYQLRRALQVIEEELWQEVTGTRVD